MLRVFSLLIIIFCVFCENKKNNVCDTMGGYGDIDENPSCWYNPDVCSLPEDIITRRGYPFESYEILTEDEYLNILYRIPHNNTHKNVTRTPILLRAGIGGGPQTFLYIGNESLAFFFVNNGFDVWLSNRRGTFESTQDRKFWNFSFHESGYHDIKPEIDFIRNKNPEKVVVLGYSMGSTESYVYAISKPKHSRKNVAGIISVAPMAFLKHFGGSLRRLTIYTNLMASYLRKNNIYAIYTPSENTTKIDRTNTSSIESIILNRQVLFDMSGRDSGQINPADLPVYFCRSTPISVKTLVHYAQEINSAGKFQQYDYGMFKNLVLYKSVQPPMYNVSKIRVPVHLFYGGADLLSTPEDVVELYNKLRVKNKSITHISGENEREFNHADFALARNVTALFHEVLLKTINEKLKE